MSKFFGYTAEGIVSVIPPSTGELRQDIERSGSRRERALGKHLLNDPELMEPYLAMRQQVIDLGEVTRKIVHKASNETLFGPNSLRIGEWHDEELSKRVLIPLLGATSLELVNKMQYTGTCTDCGWGCGGDHSYGESVFANNATLISANGTKTIEKSFWSELPRTGSLVTTQLPDGVGGWVNLRSHKTPLEVVTGLGKPHHNIDKKKVDLIQAWEEQYRHNERTLPIYNSVSQVVPIEELVDMSEYDPRKQQWLRSIALD